MNTTYSSTDFSSNDNGSVEILTMDQMQYKHASRVLEYVHGNKLRAAKLLGISRMTLYRLLGRYTPSPMPVPTPIRPASPVMSSPSAPMHSMPRYAQY